MHHFQNRLSVFVWDKLCLSGLLENLSGFLILVSCRLDYGAAFGQQTTTSPLGTEAA